jgi:hypothetical protein
LAALYWPGVSPGASQSLNTNSTSRPVRFRR